MDSRLLWGAVETLMLEIIAQGPTYGYEIAQTVTSRSEGYFQLKEGSLYPALHRLEQQRLISSYWQAVDGRRRKYYKIASSGHRALEARRAEWRAFAKGMQGVLGLQFAQ